MQSLTKLLPTAHTRECLIEAIQIANERVHEAMLAEGGRPAMGTTIVGALLLGTSCTFFNVGDSRAYILRGRVLTRHSVDHTPDAGNASGVRSHALTQSLGGTLTSLWLNPHVKEVAVSPGDLILLCSDGLTDLVKESEIAALLLSGTRHPAAALVDAALSACGRDNVTVAVLAA